MNRTFASLVSLALLASLPACGSATEGPTTPSAGPKENSGRAKLARVKEVYQAFTFDACKSGENCARTFAERASLDLGPSGKNALPNPRAELANPDPSWIPEWQELPTGEPGSHYVFEAMTLAAIHKTWRARCEQAYADYDKELTGRLDALDKDIAAKNKEPNPYDRLGGLLGLAVDKPEKGAMNEWKKGSDPVRYKYEVAVFDAFEDTGRTFVYNFDGYAPSDELLAVGHPRQGKDYELEAFCLDASQGKIASVPALPDTSSWDGQIKSMVRHAVTDERARFVERRRKEMADVSRAKFAKVKQPNPQLPTGVREMTITKIESFKRDGKGAVITSITTKEDKTKLPSGKTKTSKIDDVATTTFTDWPSNLEIASGDTVSFYGAELSVKEVIVRSTQELEHRSREYKIDGKHVTKATVKGKTTVYFR